MSFEKVIVALDFNNRKTLDNFINRVGRYLNFVKVGMELFYSEGPEVIDFLKNKNLKVFLDLKLHDIPQTVEKSLLMLKKHEVDMINVHALGGESMLKAAANVFTGSATKIIGVTILTSLDDTDCEKIHLKGNVTENVLNLAKLSAYCGLDGIVCSALEASELKTSLPPGFLYVTPGIRLNHDSGDQKRVVAPKEAFAMGSSYLVMGREITQSADPIETIEIITRNISEH
ncbi:MAG: orotidine-5'-phosphate decarboxylase [Halobacteriovoraceae bacterium]|nr:orotidine-5'-phosphate decarboxylase [Halobacteriovoraceae bacterium]